MAFNYSPKVITDGLVLYLDAANQYSYVSGSTSWNDISRGGNNGTLVNGPTYNSANGGSIVFDGVDDYVNCGNSTSINDCTNACTINVWFKQTTSSSYKFLTGKGTSDSDENLSLAVAFTNSKLYFDVGAGGPYIDVTYSYSLNTWYNICVTHNRTGGNSTLKVYINGIEIPSTTIAPSSSPISNSSNFTIGSARNNTLNFPGNIATLQLYNRALSANEVLQNYNATKTRFGL